MGTFACKCVRNCHEIKDENIIFINFIENEKVLWGDCLIFDGQQLLKMFEILGYTYFVSPPLFLVRWVHDFGFLGLSGGIEN